MCKNDPAKTTGKEPYPPLLKIKFGLIRRRNKNACTTPTKILKISKKLEKID